jgi:hypothetical protein
VLHREVGSGEAAGRERPLQLTQLSVQAARGVRVARYDRCADHVAPKRDAEPAVDPVFAREVEDDPARAPRARGRLWLRSQARIPHGRLLAGDA